MGEQARGTVRRECPLEACGWHHDELNDRYGQTLGAGLTPDELKAVAAAGQDVTFAILLADYMRVEKILRDHFASHPLEDWVLEVVRLREAIARQLDHTAILSLVARP